MNKGILFVVSAPSGSGKTTVIRELLKKEKGLVKSVSATTRPPRRGEKNKVDYLFITREEFKKRIKENYFLEWEQVFDNCYGTPRAPVISAVKNGRDVILALDVKGALKIKDRFKGAILIFLLPPSIEALKERLKGRSTDSRAQIKKRLELARWELSQKKKYDYAVINNTVENAVKRLRTIINKERSKSTAKVQN